jgi:protein-tyrosine phosphatase
MNEKEPIIEILAETDRFNLVRTQEPDGETTYHLEMGNVTVHFFREEWDELVKTINELGDYATTG